MLSAQHASCTCKKVAHGLTRAVAETSRRERWTMIRLRNRITRQAPMHSLATTGQGPSPTSRQNTPGLLEKSGTSMDASKSRHISRLAAPKMNLSRLIDFSSSSQQQRNSLVDQPRAHFSLSCRYFGDGKDAESGVLNYFGKIRRGSDEISHAISKCSSFQTLHIGHVPLLPTLAQKRPLHLYRSYATVCRSIYYQSFSGGPTTARCIFTLSNNIDWRCFSTASNNNNGGGQKTPASEAPGKASEAATIAENKIKLSTPFAAPSGKYKTVESGLSMARVKNSINSGITWMTQAIINFIVKAPGVILYYLTHPKALKEKLGEWKDHAKKEANHYWMGMKLLAADVRTARRLLSRTLHGTPLTRRERKQLLRTTADLFRLVPMSMFLIIPFMEFALPFALKLFPNMLPSTFQDSLKAEENMKRELQSRIAMAGFFQETLHGLAKKKKIQAQQILDEKENNDEEKSESEVNKEVSAAEFLDFLEHARAGEFLPPEVIIRFSKYFQDELTLDNLPRTQLSNLCRYMGIPAYGSDPFLRFQLRHKIRTLQEDDQRILWEGIDSLTKMELREACQERGMRSTGLSKEQYRVALQQWLDLSVNMNVPIALLIMSRSYFLYDELQGPTKSGESSSVTGLSDAISAMDRDLLNQVVLEVATNEERSRNPDVVKISLEVLEQENEKIKKEYEERLAAKKKEETKKKEFEEEQAKKVEADKFVAGDSKGSEESSSEQVVFGASSASPEEISIAATLDSKRKHEATSILTTASPENQEALHSDHPSEMEDEEEKSRNEKAIDAMKKDLKDNSLSAEELNALAQLTSPSSVDSERAELERIKQAILQKVEEKEIEEGEDVVQSFDSETLISLKQDILKQSASNVITKINCKHNVDEDTAHSPLGIMEDDSGMVDQKTRKAETFEESVTFSTEEENPRDSAITASDVSAKSSDTELKQEDDYDDTRLDKTVDRLKERLEKMVGKIELQLSDVDEKIGNKMHFLDKDMDGLLTNEEVAQCLRLVLKRELSFDVAMQIAKDMDSNQDGLMTVAELNRWIETNKIVRLAEEGRDEDVDRAIAKAKEKTQEKKSQKHDHES